MSTVLYIPINTDSLAHYFNRAIILPASFYKNKPEDIQNRICDSILLSKAKWVKNCDCSIEIVLTSEELNTLNSLDENFIRLNKPLPISRIKKVFFTNNQQMEITIWNINNGAAFVPQQLLSIEEVTEDKFYSDAITWEIEKSNNNNDELEKKVNRFDTVLGGFAFMKVGSSEFMEYPVNYFLTLSHFNKLIGKQVALAKQSKGFNFSDRLKGLFVSNDIEWGKWQQYIYKDVKVEDIESIAKKEGLKIEKKLGIINLNSINFNSQVFNLAILAIYGNGKNKSTDDLVSLLQIENIPIEKKEEISLIFGLNCGYTRLRNQYKSGNKSYDVKFRLNSQLDYYIIESIYQFVFNNYKDNYAFDYIDSFCIKQKTKREVKGFDTYLVLDKLIVAKKKAPLSEEYWNLYSDSICEVITDYTKKITPPFLQFNKEDSNKFFKELLRERVVSYISDFEKKVTKAIEQDFENEIFKIKTENEQINTELNKEISLLKTSSHNINNVITVVNESEDELIVNNKSYLKIIDYNKFKIKELLIIAKFLGVKGYSKFSTEGERDELVLLIKNNKTIL